MAEVTMGKKLGRALNPISVTFLPHMDRTSIHPEKKRDAFPIPWEDLRVRTLKQAIRTAPHCCVQDHLP